MKVPLSLLDNQRDINGIEKKPFGFILVIDYLKKKVTIVEMAKCGRWIWFEHQQ
jgi:hypothetical protein